MSETLIFAYGSFLKGEADHALLSPCECLGSSRTQPGYRLVELSTFPALIETGDLSIVGELYSVPHQVLMSLDAKKEIGRLFHRRAIQLESGQSAQAYLMDEQQVRGRRRLTTSDWRLRFAAVPRRNDGPRRF